MNGRPIVTPSQSPRSIAPAITDAVWKPPVTITGTDTAALTARDSGRLMPSMPLFERRSQSHLKIRLIGQVRNMR